jgi:hypothetical protein
MRRGQVIQEKHDIKGDVLGGAIGTGRGTLVGAVFSHVVRGFGFGLAGSDAYIVARKGKDCRASRADRHARPHGQHHHGTNDQRQQCFAHRQQPLKISSN